MPQRGAPFIPLNCVSTYLTGVAPRKRPGQAGRWYWGNLLALWNTCPDWPIGMKYRTGLKCRAYFSGAKFIPPGWIVLLFIAGFNYRGYFSSDFFQLNIFFKDHPHKHRICLCITLPHPARLLIYAVAPFKIASLWVNNSNPIHITFIDWHSSNYTLWIYTLLCLYKGE